MGNRVNLCGFDGDGDELSSLSQPQDPAGLSSIESLINVGQLTQPEKVRTPEFPIEVRVGYTILFFTENTLFIEKIELTQGKDNTNITTWYLCFGAYVYSVCFF